jgi:ABC-type cobalamin transport system permease subunit
MPGWACWYFSRDDRQLRDINFWMLGSLSGATWTKVGAIAPFLSSPWLASAFIARGLDLLVLGEMEAFHAGVSVERLKRTCVVLVAAAAGAAVSVSGVIGFVGLVVPHLLRLLIGPGHRLLLPTAALLWRRAAGDRRHVCAHAGGAGGTSDRHRHRGDRGASSSSICCCGSVRCSVREAGS